MPNVRVSPFKFKSSWDIAGEVKMKLQGECAHVSKAVSRKIGTRGSVENE